MHICISISCNCCYLLGIFSDLERNTVQVRMEKGKVLRGIFLCPVGWSN